MKNKPIIRILLVFALFFGLAATACTQGKKEETVAIKTSAVCGQCKDRIEKGLGFEKGIKDVTLDLETKIATVKYSPGKTSPDEIRRIISKLGYDADEVKADSVAYEKLPACCKKDAPEH
jgi:copper chaperone CopZ